jgi:putative SOS response-associated peptidase YedK
MCGRFTLTVHQLGSVIDKLGATVDPELAGLYRPRYNIAPGDQHWMLRRKEGARILTPAGWGLINSWAKDPNVGFRQINARAETLAERPAFRDSFQRKRCLIPADGFYEWRGPRGQREPLRFHLAERFDQQDDGLILFAGLYDGWCDPTTGEWRKTFTIITTEPNAAVRPVHDRMPAIIPMNRADDWLAGEHPGALLGPAPDPDGLLVVTPASPRVNTARYDDPDLLDPDDPRVPKQLGLF